MSVPPAQQPQAGKHPSPDSDDVAALILSDLVASTERVELLEREHLELLNDPGVNQEDRDASAMLLAAARVNQAAAQAAADRIADGSYGRCAACGREIPRERLEAVPETTHCVECPG